MENPLYETDDYGKAAYLLHSGHNFIGAAGKKDHYKKYFVFEETPELLQDAQNWEENRTQEASNYKGYFIRITEVKKSLREVLDV